MARASTWTMIPLDRVARILQIDPLHFNAVQTSLSPITNACDDVWHQHDWQTAGKISRESLAMALQRAEDEVTQRLGYAPIPIWFVGEDHPLPKPIIPESNFANEFNLRSQKKSIIADYGYVIEGGQRATEVIELLSAVVYSDADGDGYNETGTVMVATTVTDPEEIAVFYPGKLADETWEIRPVSVSIAAGVATITFPKVQAVLETLMEKIANPADPSLIVDGDVDANFLDEVDVYRVYNDPSQQAAFYTEGSCSSCGGLGCESCGYTSESGCLYVRDSRRGILAYARADWDDTDLTFYGAAFSNGRLADQIKIWYRAGWRNQKLATPYRTMDATWERLITYYSLTFIDTELCGGENTKRIWSHMREDLAQNVEHYSFTETDFVLNCPLGTTRAAVQLWRRITSPNTRLVKAR